MFVVAAMAVVLIGATAFATDSAFADGKKKYGKSQAISQVNECGNGVMPKDIVCRLLLEKIKGDKNRLATAADQTFS